ncbi:MAG: hypothetical protein NVSMB26_28090 [Beijerinckiaceae bacterium]
MRNVWAVVPIKSFAQAKARLAPLLDAGARAELAGLMARDVLDGLGSLPDLAGIVVVTHDECARALAAERGAIVVDDPAEIGPNEAIRLALPTLTSLGAEAMIVVPSDLPQLDPDDIKRVLDHLGERSVVLVPATRDGGTNILACAPIDLVPPCFGIASLVRHNQAARDAGIAPQIVAPESLLCDIDRPDDLAIFYARRSPTRSQAYLESLHLPWDEQRTAS